MADEPREWADIDKEWLQGYLQENQLASELDLEDELIGAQVSWILSADDWDKLRGAWNRRRGVEDVRGDATRDQEAAESPAVTESQPELVDAAPSQAEVQTPQVAGEAAQGTAESVDLQGTLVAEPDDQPDELRRLNELSQKALSDWGAFRELFRDCLESAGVDAWEALADSPVALLTQAEQLMYVEQVKAEEKKRQQDRMHEEEVRRARNIIAGYLIYCRKRGIVPSHEHLVGYIPVLRTGYSPQAVKEAWRRETEPEVSKKG